MKKIIVLLLNIVFFTPLFSSFISEQEKKAHPQEAEKITAAWNDLITNLMALETAMWIDNLNKANFTFPETVLTQAEVSSLLKALDDLESGDALSTRYRLNLPNKLKPIFSNIKTNALYITEQMPIKRGAKWFKREDTWKPVLLNFFRRAKILIKSFGPQTQKQTLNWSQPEGYTSHYFPRPKSG